MGWWGTPKGIEFFGYEQVHLTLAFKAKVKLWHLPSIDHLSEMDLPNQIHPNQHSFHILKVSFTPNNTMQFGQAIYELSRSKNQCPCNYRQRAVI